MNTIKETIGDIMTSKLLTVTADATLEEIKRIFDNNDFHHLPVVDNLQAIGIISKADLLRELDTISIETSGKTWTKLTSKEPSAGQIMTPNPLHVEPEDSLGLAADIFLSNQIHSLLVVDDGELQGIITTHDLLDYAYKNNYF